MKTSTISFFASGNITQEIVILNDESIEMIVQKLSEGDYYTTLTGDQPMIEDSEGNIIAKVIDINNELEYSDFEIDDFEF